MTEEQIQAACDLRLDGWTWGQISARIDVEESTIRRRVIPRIGHTIPDRWRKAREAAALRDAGWKYKDITDHLGYGSEGAAARAVQRFRKRPIDRLPTRLLAEHTAERDLLALHRRIGQAVREMKSISADVGRLRARLRTRDTPP